VVSSAPLSNADVNSRSTDRFARDLSAAPPRVRKDFEKQLRFLLRDLRHPSLEAKKYDEVRDIWQALDGWTKAACRCPSHPV